MSIPEWEAEAVAGGFRYGDIDAADLAAMLEDYGRWVRRSRSETARIVRSYRSTTK